MFRSHSDLPLESDESSRFIPWIIALMVYLACLALAGALLARGAAARWSQGLTGSLTVQILPSQETGPQGQAPSDAAPKRAMQIDTALVILRTTPGVAHADALSDQRVAALLEPWLGPGGTKDLALPALIDVSLKPGIEIDSQALAKHLADAVPGAVLDDHRRWLNRAVELAHSVVAVAIAIMLMVAATAAAVTVFGTRTALAIHRNIVEVMHLIGAQDGYVARQFQNHALRIGLRGGMAGLLGAVVTLLALRWTAEPLGVTPFPEPEFGIWHWVALLLLPVAIALIAMLTARVTVLRTLARMI